MTPYGEFIRSQLVEERARKASLEQRGNLVITSSGVLVSLLFALAAVVTKDSGYAAAEEVRLLLAIAGGLFVLAGVGGLLANMPWRYEEPTSAGLAELATADVWADPEDAASRRVAAAEAGLVRSTRLSNSRKAVCVLSAFSAEILAVVCVATAAVVMLTK